MDYPAFCYVEDSAEVDKIGSHVSPAAPGLV